MAKTINLAKVSLNQLRDITLVSLCRACLTYVSHCLVEARMELLMRIAVEMEMEMEMAIVIDD